MSPFSRFRDPARRFSYPRHFMLPYAADLEMDLAAVCKAYGWQYQVLLCVSNPGGATQYLACVPPITKLWKHLSLAGAFPTCTGRGVSKTKVNNLKDPARRSVTMTYDDGRRSTLSLAGIEGNGAP